MGYIEFNKVTKLYTHGDHQIIALDAAEFFAKKGEFVVITGASGSGKSTILNILAGMDVVTAGTVHVAGKDITAYDEKALEEYRRNFVGYVLSSDNLIPTLTILENVELAARLTSRPFDPVRALDNVDLADKKNQFPWQLTRAEQQKAAIARAMVKNSSLILCDEPVAHLTGDEGRDVLNTLFEICRETERTVVLATQNEAVTGMGDRIIRMRSGRVMRKYVNKNQKDIGEIVW